jgi:hypothetical protein
MKPPRLILFAARWAIMSGLAGTVFAILVFTDRDRAAATTQSGMLLAAAALLAVAFILTPFVRRAFVRSAPAKAQAAARKTLLDEMRAEGDPPPDAIAEPVVREPRSVTQRLLVGLYVVYGAVLAAVLWAM